MVWQRQTPSRGFSMTRLMWPVPNTPRRIPEFLLWQVHRRGSQKSMQRPNEHFLTSWPWPMTLTYKFGLDILPLDLHAKIQVCMSRYVCPFGRGSGNRCTHTDRRCQNYYTRHVPDVGCNEHTIPNMIVCTVYIYIKTRIGAPIIRACVIHINIICFCFFLSKGPNIIYDWSGKERSQKWESHQKYFGWGSWHHTIKAVIIIKWRSHEWASKKSPRNFLTLAHSPHIGFNVRWPALVAPSLL